MGFCRRLVHYFEFSAPFSSALLWVLSTFPAPYRGIPPPYTVLRRLIGFCRSRGPSDGVWSKVNMPCETKWEIYWEFDFLNFVLLELPTHTHTLQWIIMFVQQHEHTPNAQTLVLTRRYDLWGIQCSSNAHPLPDQQTRRCGWSEMSNGSTHLLKCARKAAAAN